MQHFAYQSINQKKKKKIQNYHLKIVAPLLNAIKMEIQYSLVSLHSTIKLSTTENNRKENTNCAKFVVNNSLKPHVHFTRNL